MNEPSAASVGAITYDVWFSYTDRGSRPPRFQAYRHARWEKLDDWGRLTCEDVDKTTTQDELDFALKRDLRMTPEERYQLGKRSFLFHDLSCYLRDLSDEEYGCTGAGCIPECRFYPEYGRIEDAEVIDEHNKFVEKLRRENRIVEPPSESEMLRILKELKLICTPYQLGSFRPVLRYTLEGTEYAR
ncbi:MAG: hypothetical protein WBP64_08005 [Nitrososphaeraceae archaeon]